MYFQFKIKIEGLSKPPVWRRVDVPATLTFLQFHQAIQTVFGWGNAHLWCFLPRTKGVYTRPAFCIVEPDEDRNDWLEAAKTLVASDTKLDTICLRMKELVYKYDFGDGWSHLITLENVVMDDLAYPMCAGGKGSTPPEDCGGISGYMELKDAFAERNEAKMKFYREWLGFEDDEDWNPNSFCAQELKDINQALRNITVDESSVAPRVFVSKYASSPYYYSTQALLKYLKMPELRLLANAFGYQFKSGITKDLQIECITDWMLNRPENLIEGAFCYELKAFLDIIDGKMSAEYAEESELLYDLNRFGLIYALDNRISKTSTLHFQMDIADLLKPRLQAELERRERDGSMLLEQLALGCANIYGFTRVEYLIEYVDEVEKRIGSKLDDAALTRAFYPVLRVMQSDKKGGPGYFLSPFARSVDFYPDEAHVQFDLAAKTFDLDTILKFGEMPYPQFPGKEVDEMRKNIGRYGKSGVNPDFILRRLWLQKQGFMQINQILREACEGDLARFAEEQSSIDALTGYMNSMPCWQFRGSSSRDLFNDSYRHAIGQNLQPLPFRALAKIGRNDPCPCGSGKKYKNCCGRNT